jgi:hypothetical protein
MITAISEVVTEAISMNESNSSPFAWSRRDNHFMCHDKETKKVRIKILDPRSHPSINTDTKTQWSATAMAAPQSNGTQAKP